MSYSLLSERLEVAKYNKSINFIELRDFNIFISELLKFNSNIEMK